MALKGTLKDFGIADILQLIGQQQKTGELRLTYRRDSVVVTFKDGSIIWAESTSRNRKELIGSMMVAATLLTEEQLQAALDAQKRTLQRLGDVLVSQNMISAEKFQSIVLLQTNETLFKLFSWQAGTYQFDQKAVETETTLPPLSAESVLMEGFRRVDEWPEVRKRITSLQMTFEPTRELPPEELKKDDFDDALAGVFGEDKKSSSKKELETVGANERLVYNLIAPGRTVERLIELSLLGEFETAKALSNLILQDYVKGIAPSGDAGRSFGSDADKSNVVGAIGRVAITMVMLGAVLFIGTRIDLGVLNMGRSSATTYADSAAQRFVGQQQRSRVAAALDVFKLEKGFMPAALEELVEAKLLSADDLHFPWRDPYFYRRQDDGTYVLLPPLR